MKYLRFSLTAGIRILILSIMITCTPRKVHEESKVNALNEIEQMNVKSDKTIDSLKDALKHHKGDLTEKEILDIHTLLQKIIDEKSKALDKLEAINARMDVIEGQVKEYVKNKESVRLKEKLLEDIQKLKNELNDIKPKTLNEIVQKPIPNSTKSLKDLPAGNYTTRIDKTHILKFFVSPDSDIFVSPVILDSTTILKGGQILNPKVIEQIRKIKDGMK